MALPRVLVLANDPFSLENSNGRTLGNFFLDYPKEQLAQLFLNADPLDMIDCRYFQISDRSLLRHFTHFSKVGQERHYDPHPLVDSNSAHPSVKKNPYTCLLRDHLWKTKAWSTSRFWSWVSHFDPQVILLQAGDMPYLFDLALIVKKKTNAKLVIYNSEDYYFKTWNYMLDENGHKALYPKFHRRFYSAFRKAMEVASLAIYNSEYLQEDYQKEFPGVHSEVLYTSTTWTPTPYVPKEGFFQVTYFGNISDGRAEGLIDIANALALIKRPYSFDVYGNVSRKEDKTKLLGCSGLHLHDPVPYSELRSIADASDLLVHVESFDPYLAKDRKNAFSTKIADCLASGRPFLVYAPKEMAMSRYLEKTHSAYLVSSRNDLSDVLTLIEANRRATKDASANAQTIVDKNHRIDCNNKRLTALLESL